MRVRGTTVELDELARKMRRAPTAAEALLWASLRLRPGGAKFRRQHAVGRFVFDFVCVAARLVIEIDGAAHDDTAQRDAERDVTTRAAGYRVLRFRNEEVLGDQHAVIAKIAAHVAAPRIGGT